MNRSSSGDEVRSSGESGASLMELLMAVSIAGVLFAIGVPSVSNVFAVYALHGASGELVANLQKARVAAASQNNRFVVHRTNAHTYTIHDDDDGDGVQDDGEAVTTIDTAQQWPGISITSTGDVTFRPDGSALSAVTFTVTAQNGTDSVTVSTAGRIRAE